MSNAGATKETPRPHTTHVLELNVAHLCNLVDCIMGDFGGDVELHEAHLLGAEEVGVGVAGRHLERRTAEASGGEGWGGRRGGLGVEIRAETETVGCGVTTMRASGVGCVAGWAVGWTGSKHEVRPAGSKPRASDPAQRAQPAPREDPAWTARGYGSMATTASDTRRWKGRRGLLPARPAASGCGVHFVNILFHNRYILFA